MHNHPTTKTCPKCRRNLTVEAFNKNRSARDGVQVYCRDCTNAADKVRRQQNREVYLAQSAAAARERHRRNPEPHREEAAKWQRENPARRRTIDIRYSVRNPEKVAAHDAVGKAVRAGKIIKQPCIRCGDTKVQAHHHLGYEREHWLHVVWLCSACHRAAHAIASMRD